jgi:hypothetical protein
MFCSLGWGQFEKIFLSTPSMRFKACDVEVVVMITSLSRSWNTDLRTLYAYLQGSLDQFLAWHYHRLFFSPEAFYLSLIFFCHGLGVKSSCSWGLLPWHPSCKTIGFASPRSSSHGLLVGFTLNSVRFALRLLHGSLDSAKCICFFSS